MKTNKSTRAGRQKQIPSPKVIQKMEQHWTPEKLKRIMGRSNTEQKPKIITNDIPVIKYNKIYTKQVDNSFKLTGYKCSLCHKLFSDDTLLKTHPLVCPELINT